MYTRIDISDTSNLYQETEGEVKKISTVRAFLLSHVKDSHVHLVDVSHVCCCDMPLPTNIPYTQPHILILFITLIVRNRLPR
jgi:hypothetical protein